MSIMRSGCPYCSNHVPKTEKDYHDLAKLRGFQWLGPMVDRVTKKTWWECPKGHRWETYYSNTQQGAGCPICLESRGEGRVARFLGKFGIKNIRQKTFTQCRREHPLPFDFYFRLEGKPFLIEYDGKQHFIPIECFGGIKNLEDIQSRDKIKTEFAQSYGFILIRVHYKVKNIEQYLKLKIEQYISFTFDDIILNPTFVRELNPRRDFIHGEQLRLL